MIGMVYYCNIRIGSNVSSALVDAVKRAAYYKVNRTMSWSSYCHFYWDGNWVTFSSKIGICMGLLSNLLVVHPYQTKFEYPPSSPHPTIPNLVPFTSYSIAFNEIKLVLSVI